MILILSILVVLSFIFLFFYKCQPGILGGLGVLLVFGIFAYFCTYIQAIIRGDNVAEMVSWVPELRVNIRFYLDGLSLFFALLISLFGFFILLYSIGYMRGKLMANRYFFYLILFLTSMTGLVLSDHLILLYVFWEMTSISSYFLITYNSHKKKARNAALQALLVTNLGGLALFAGLLLLGHQYDSFYLSTIVSKAPGLTGMNAVILLILIGCFTKSAQFPFHFWLPNAMEAPSPVSAYLHSATMVKAGVFLLLRLNPIFSTDLLWQSVLLLIGSITMLLGAINAIKAFDLKSILASITISTLGVLVALIGIGTERALQGAILYLTVHALYKAVLFLVAGNVDKQVGTRDVRKLSGLYRHMPLTGLATLLAGLALAGLPPVLGFVVKEQLYGALLGDFWYMRAFLTVFVLTNAIYFMLAIKLSYGLFFGKSVLPQGIKEVSVIMWVPPVLLAVIGLGLGLIGVYLEAFFTAVSKVTMNGSGVEEIDLSFWHGVNIAFILSILTWLAGLIFYIAGGRFKQKARKVRSFSFDRMYQVILFRLQSFALLVTRFFQHGFLTRYLKVIFILLIILLSSMYIEGQLFSEIHFDIKRGTFSEVYGFFPLLLIFTGTVFILRTSSRLRILVCLSLVGYGIALFYAVFSAPDVSMTQFLVETITLVIFTIVLNRLPKSATFPLEPRKILITGVSIAFGIIMTFILISVQQYPLNPALKDFYIQNSIPRGHGENVVNVMLVDFRAFDTFGEMVVLSMTALGVVALINLKSKERKL
ncbi:hydrogen gas-evolving membrane-bound hydrogenase subunit E [Olivibacter sp. CPCC 100613]|uniref:hydrogen gas-evolving membrane-bound hydrogenase subunit E n=1 Tax=Olivibacter sp. CPCC 100613 TaxID=3079931 RepID=UPI002FF476D1